MKKLALVALLLISMPCFAYKQPKAPLYQDCGRNKRIVMDNFGDYPMTDGHGNYKGAHIDDSGEFHGRYQTH